MQDKLLIGVLGNKGAGKTHTWNILFGRRVKTGKNLRRLYLSDIEYVNVFLINGSPEERKKNVDLIIKNRQPAIILCSIEYTPALTRTFNYFIEKGYFLFIHWLSPGYQDENSPKLFYNLGIINHVLKNHSLVGVRNAKTGLDERIGEIRDFLYGWARSRNLLLEDKDGKIKTKQKEQ